MKCYLLSGLLLIVLSFRVSAQHEYDNWYFGNHAGISFVNGDPINLPLGSISTWEGSSSISDSAGNLLFYTDGVIVYNANHDTMPNGFGLHGHYSSTQSALIVKDPANSYQYYIFTTGAGTTSLKYSIVDMTLQNGLGDVTAVKNVLLISGTYEKLAGVQNAQGDGYWIITNRADGSYYSYPLTTNGIGQPVISYVSALNTELFPYVGQLKISPDGTRIANAKSRMHSVEVGDFDILTGEVTNTFLIYPPVVYSALSIYGVEFSSSSNIVYMANNQYNTSEMEEIYQVDLNAGDATAINASVQVIFSDSLTPLGAMQLASNGKIYVVWYQDDQVPCYLDVINSPNLLGVSCDYEHNGFLLDSGMSFLFGLPNILVIPHFYPEAQIQLEGTSICPDSCISFGNQSTSASSYEWFFQGGNPNYSMDEFPTVCYNTSGFYDVTLIAHNGPYSDTTTSSNLIEVYAPPTPIITQSNDTLYATNVQAGSTYQWLLNGNVISSSTNPFYTPTINGTYEVVVTSEDGCSGTDEFLVTTVGTNELTESTFQLFPNPADESVTVSLSNHQQATIKLYNTLGQIILNDLVEKQTTIDLSKLSAGVYYISIQTENDLVTQRLIVTHR